VILPSIIATSRLRLDIDRPADAELVPIADPKRLGELDLVILDQERSRSSPMKSSTTQALRTIGRVHSPLKRAADAPKQGDEGAPNARVQIKAAFLRGLDGIAPGQEMLILTRLHQADREVLAVHPRDDLRNPLTGVFATRSPDRPNPIGVHRVKVLEIQKDGWLLVQGLEAIDGTPVVDIKPVLRGER
jgi:tRNA-Thr(GGU) m(6)t(6)A37 methyltransferase TsaA